MRITEHLLTWIWTLSANRGNTISGMFEQGEDSSTCTAQDYACDLKGNIGTCKKKWRQIQFSISTGRAYVNQMKIYVLCFVFYVSVCLTIHMSVSVCLSICLSIWSDLSVYLIFLRSVCLPTLGIWVSSFRLPHYLSYYHQVAFPFLHRSRSIQLLPELPSANLQRAFPCRLAHLKQLRERLHLQLRQMGRSSFPAKLESLREWRVGNKCFCYKSLL